MIFLLSSSIYVMLIIKCVTPDTNVTSEMHERDEIVLSRRKRYLIFPEGSSLQLVYCLTVPSIGMGQIFTIGGTAALAWELPHTPFRKQTELLHRKVDKVGVQTSGGWTLQDTRATPNDKHRKTYYKTFITNNLSSSLYDSTIDRNRQTIYNSPSYRRYFKRKNDRTNFIYRTINNKNNFENNYGFHQQDTSYVHPEYHFIHRKTRRDLYSKIEKFFTAQSKDGKACLLKAVCEVCNASLDTVGTFMQEIIKAIFRVKPHENYQDEDQYDLACNKNHNCTEKYLTCKSTVWNMF